MLHLEETRALARGLVGRWWCRALEWKNISAHLTELSRSADALETSEALANPR